MTPPVASFRAIPTISVACAAGLVCLVASPAAAQKAGTTSEVAQCAATDGDDAQATEKASLRYSRGVELYEQGAYEAAIKEFADGYCLAPNPEMLKNIAQSFERMAEYDRTVAYLERYIVELPPQEAAKRKRTRFRVDVLKRLPARIGVASTPAGAEVILENRRGVVSRGTANPDQPLEVRSGSYQMTVSLPGYESVTREVKASIGRAYSYVVELPRLRGTLRVSASPANARIFLDKKLVAIGSYSESLPVGRYEIMVEAEDRPVKIRSAAVVARKTTALSIDLEERERSGRRELIIGSTVAGGVFGGVALSSVFSGSDNPSLITAGAFGGLGVGFAGGYFGVPKETTVASANFIISSTTIVALEAGLISAYLLCDQIEEADGSFGTDCTSRDSEITAGVALSAAMVGAVTSAVLASRLELKTGDIALVNSGAIWGATTGALFFSAFEDDARVREPLILAGLNLGMVATALLAARVDISRRRTALIDLSGLGGLIAGVALGQAVAGDGTERVDHFALIGMATGLITGGFLTRFFDDPTPKNPGSLQPQVTSVRDLSGDVIPAYGVSASF